MLWPGATGPYLKLNNGITFLIKYDRRHNLNLIALYKYRQITLELSAVFSFSKTRPKTVVPIIRTTDVSNDAENMRTYAATF